MAEYIAFDPNVEVCGNSILAVVAAVGEKALSVLAKHGLDIIESQGWSPQQPYLNAFKEISKQDFMKLVSIGMKIPDFAQFPREIETVHDALGLLDVACQMNHRHGEYAYEKLGDCMAQKFHPMGNPTVTVRRNDQETNRKSGADTCIDVIDW